MTITGSTNKTTKFKLEVEETSYSISDNTSQVRVRAYIGQPASNTYMYGCSINVKVSCTSCSDRTISYSNSGRVDLYTDSWLYLGETTFTVPHNSNGSKDISISATMTNNVEPRSGSASGSMSLTRIPRYSVISSADNFNDTQNPTIKFSNPSNGYFSLQAKLEAGGNTKLITRNISATATSYTFNLTESERALLRSLIPNTNSLSVRFTICCMDGNNELSASYLDRTMNIIDANPLFENFTFKDINQDTIALTGDENTFVKNKSKLEVTISSEDKAIAQKQATIKYYQVLDSKQDYSSSEDVILTVNDYGYDNISVLAVDSRGNTTTKTNSVTKFINYVSITKGDISLSRSDNGVGKFVTLKFDGEFWNDNFGLVDNDLVVNYKFKKTNEEEYITGETIIQPNINGSRFSYEGLIAGDTEDKGFDINSTYDFIVGVSDKIDTKQFITILNAGVPAIAIYKNNVSIGAKYDRTLGGNQLWGKVFLNGSPIIESGSNDDGEWIKFENGIMVCCKQVTFTATCNNQWGSMYESEQIDFGYMPQEFIEIPTIVTGNLSRTALLEGFQQTTKSHFGLTWIMRPVIDTSSATYIIHLIAIGRWKKSEEGE